MGLKICSNNRPSREIHKHKCTQTKSTHRALLQTSVRGAWVRTLDLEWENGAFINNAFLVGARSLCAGKQKAATFCTQHLRILNLPSTKCFCFWSSKCALAFNKLQLEDAYERHLQLSNTTTENALFKATLESALGSGHYSVKSKVCVFIGIVLLFLKSAWYTHLALVAKEERTS